MIELVPAEFYLSQNYPNPFGKKTVIKYCVPYKSWVKLTVFNSTGEKIIQLVDEEKKPGTYEVEFEATASIWAVWLRPSDRKLTMEKKAENKKLKDNSSRILSPTDKPVEKARIADREYLYRLEAHDYICEKRMIHLHSKFR